MGWGEIRFSRAQPRIFYPGPSGSRHGPISTSPVSPRGGWGVKRPDRSCCTAKPQGRGSLGPEPAPRMAPRVPSRTPERLGLCDHSSIHPFISQVHTGPGQEPPEVSRTRHGPGPHGASHLEAQERSTLRFHSHTGHVGLRARSRLKHGLGLELCLQADLGSNPSSAS